MQKMRDQCQCRERNESQSGAGPIRSVRIMTAATRRWHWEHPSAEIGLDRMDTRCYNAEFDGLARMSAVQSQLESAGMLGNSACRSGRSDRPAEAMRRVARILTTCIVLIAFAAPGLAAVDTATDATINSQRHQRSKARPSPSATSVRSLIAEWSPTRVAAAASTNGDWDRLPWPDASPTGLNVCQPRCLFRPLRC